MSNYSDMVEEEYGISEEEFRSANTDGFRNALEVSGYAGGRPDKVQKAMEKFSEIENPFTQERVVGALNGANALVDDPASILDEKGAAYVNSLPEHQIKNIQHTAAKYGNDIVNMVVSGKNGFDLQTAAMYGERAIDGLNKGHTINVASLKHGMPVLTGQTASIAAAAHASMDAIQPTQKPSQPEQTTTHTDHAKRQEINIRQSGPQV